MFWHWANGGVLSRIVTVALHVEEFPLISVTVSVTVFGPMFAHVNEFGFTEKVSAPPQFEEEPPSTSAPVIVALPVASRETVMSWHNATGATLSSTVTVAVHVETIPLLSVTVRVTVFGPTLAQVNELGLTERVAMPQASEEPLSTWAAVIVALPVASS